MVVKRPPKTEALRKDGDAAQTEATAGVHPVVLLNKQPTPVPKRGKGWFLSMLLAMTVLCTIGNVQQQQLRQQQQQQQQQQQPSAWPGNAIEVPKYPLRDVSHYDKSKRSMIEKAKSFGNLSNCLSYECTNERIECDTLEPTNYNYNNYNSTDDNRKPKQPPPCCIHILRDMARVFDDEMSRLGLDYTAGFGTLLGLRRSDKLIPWTVDNDYILETKQVAIAMIDLWNATSTGLSILYQGLPRMCATKDFANGQLAQWEIAKATNYKRLSKNTYQDQLWNQGYPYMDFYVGNGRVSKPRLHGGNPDDKSSKKLYFWELKECLHLYENIFPTKRIKVYGKSFSQNVPAHTDQILADKYGTNWNIPRPGNSGHGSRTCGPSEYWAIKRSNLLQTLVGSLGPLLFCLYVLYRVRRSCIRRTRSMDALIRAHLIG